MQELRQNLVPGWSISLRRNDLKDLDSVMGRPRCFIIGLHPKMEQVLYKRNILSRPYSCVHKLVLKDFPDKGSSQADYENWTIRQQTNVTQYLQTYHESIRSGSESQKAGVFATVAAGRDPNLKFCSDIAYDALSTLRTNHSDVWLLPSPGKQSVYGSMGRKITLKEKCRMIGVCPGSVADVTDSALETALGNCIAVQSMACVLGPLSAAWMTGRQEQKSDIFFADLSQDQEEDE